MATMLCFQVRSPIVCARFLTPNVASLQVKRKSLEQANISAQPTGLRTGGTQCTLAHQWRSLPPVRSTSLFAVLLLAARNTFSQAIQTMDLNAPPVPFPGTRKTTAAFLVPPSFGRTMLAVLTGIHSRQRRISGKTSDLQMPYRRMARFTGSPSRRKDCKMKFARTCSLCWKPFTADDFRTRLCPSCNPSEHGPDSPEGVSGASDCSGPRSGADNRAALAAKPAIPPRAAGQNDKAHGRETAKENE